MSDHGGQARKRAKLTLGELHSLFCELGVTVWVASLMEFLFRWAGVLFLRGASWHLDEVPKAQREHGDCPIHDVTLGVLSVKHVLAELSNDTRLALSAKLPADRGIAGGCVSILGVFQNKLKTVKDVVPTPQKEPHPCWPS